MIALFAEAAGREKAAHIDFPIGKFFP